jgi:hypothetical protein
MVIQVTNSTMYGGNYVRVCVAMTAFLTLMTTIDTSSAQEAGTYFMFSSFFYWNKIQTTL